MVRNILPDSISSFLWGDRKKWGLTVNENDPCWKEWQNTYMDFYQANQRKGVGTRINDSGYRIMSRLEMTGKTVLEIGPGDIRHIRYWKNKPSTYLLADIQQAMLDSAEEKLKKTGVTVNSHLMKRGQPLPFEDASVDVIVSFYSLEHIYPLSPYIRELLRILKPGGLLAGAIPAEGGFAWGLGRFLTSRRWIKKNSNIDPDKIICWEHPNFADEILAVLEELLNRERVEYWPFPWFHNLDMNLVIRFIYRKKE